MASPRLSKRPKTGGSSSAVGGSSSSFGGNGVDIEEYFLLSPRKTGLRHHHHWTSTITSSGNELERVERVGPPLALDIHRGGDYSPLPPRLARKWRTWRASMDGGEEVGGAIGDMRIGTSSFLFSSSATQKEYKEYWRGKRTYCAWRVRPFGSVLLVSGLVEERRGRMWISARSRAAAFRSRAIISSCTQLWETYAGGVGADMLDGSMIAALQLLAPGVARQLFLAAEQELIFFLLGLLERHFFWIHGGTFRFRRGRPFRFLSIVGG